MKMVKITLKVILVMVLIVLTFIIYFKYMPIQPNAEISQTQLKSSINKIVRSYTNVLTNCEVWDETDKLRFKNDNIAIINNMDKNQIIISISGGDGVSPNLSNREVYGIFECWLFLKDKKTVHDVIAICWSYTSSGIFTTTDKTTIITKPEFELVYENTDISELNQKQAAKVLADKWIETTGYNKI